MKHYGEWGGRNTYPHYHAGWAMAGNTPFKYCKGVASRSAVMWAADVGIRYGTFDLDGPLLNNNSLAAVDLDLANASR